MNLSKRDQKLLLVLLGIVIFIVAWVGVRNKYADKTTALESELSALTPRLEELRGYKENIATYEDGVTQIESSVRTELSKFPNDVRTEDMIMYASGLEGALGLSVGSISFMPAELLTQFSVPSEENGAVVLIPYAALRTGLSISCELNYAQMKKLVEYIYSTPQRTTLESLSVSYNSETGTLTGTASLAKYFLSGETYVYSPTTVPNAPQGTDNPFGTTDGEINVAESPSPSLSPLPPTATPKPSQSPSGGGSGSGSN